MCAFLLSGPTVWIKPTVIGSLKGEGKNRSNVGLCVKNLVNYQDDYIPDMVTFLEMHRILGVEQVLKLVPASDIKLHIFTF